jgi:hypothetical protein
LGKYVLDVEYIRVAEKVIMEKRIAAKIALQVEMARRVNVQPGVSTC